MQRTSSGRTVGQDGFQAKDLVKLRAGFGPFFKGWLADQEALWKEAGQLIDRETTDHVLSLLACALGPLLHADLATLSRKLCGSQFRLPQAGVRALERFVLGDGRQQGEWILISCQRTSPVTRGLVPRT